MFAISAYIEDEIPDTSFLGSGMTLQSRPAPRIPLTRIYRLFSHPHSFIVPKQTSSFPAVRDERDRELANL
ncbi:hypothetical protein ISX50_10225 [Vibrio cyclitrophicus]|nr:hypothetical protein [Vibrio cyclitrophicus]UPR33480.1 hypothetical protein ISX50_10225 [Vibrio cyclitrophicus]